jgi:tRNA G18 (ribose-2'-O)-methylase SpoU
MASTGIRQISTQNDLFQILFSLKTNRKKRSEHGELFVEGIEAIKQAVRGNWKIRRILSADFGRLSQWAQTFIRTQSQAELLQLTEPLYQELSDKEEPSEIMATVEMKRMDPSDVRLSDNPLILIFDRPSDQGNLGTLIRSANALGVEAVAISGHGVDPFDPKTIRASLGAVFHTPVVMIESADKLEGWLNGLKATCGLLVVGTDSEGDATLADSGIRRPIALILGNEAKGMSVRLKQYADRIVSIPLCGEVNSLNVACAGSICLWQIHANSQADSRANSHVNSQADSQTYFQTNSQPK